MMIRLPALAAACALAAAAAPAFAVDYTPTANLQYDFARIDSDDPRYRDDDAFRRARLGFKAKGKAWQFVAEHDFTERSAADAFLELTPRKGHALKLGQFKQAFTLEDAISDKSAPFLETSPLGAFAFNRRMGVEYAYTGARAALNVAAFDQRVDGTQKTRGVTARGTYVAMRNDAGLLHVGASLASDDPEVDTASFSLNPGTALTPVRVAGTGTLRHVDRIDRAAMEALWIGRAISLQAELGQVRVQRPAGRDFAGNAQAVVATWSPTGHARSYKRGVPGSHGADHGAVELALRVAQADLTDAGVNGGRARSVGVAASWFPNAHVRVGANLVRTHRSGVADAPVVATVRIQLVY